jgi:hypothetical protein
MNNRQAVKSKKELIALIFAMLDHNNAVEWENETAYTFLQALAAWLEDSDGYYSNMKIPMDTNAASWQLFADALQAAAIYE